MSPLGASAPSASWSALRSGRSQAISFFRMRQLRAGSSTVSGSAAAIRRTSSHVAMTAFSQAAQPPASAASSAQTVRATAVNCSSAAER
jgi:hypothetical protein